MSFGTQVDYLVSRVNNLPKLNYYLFLFEFVLNNYYPDDGLDTFYIIETNVCKLSVTVVLNRRVVTQFWVANNINWVGKN